MSAERDTPPFARIAHYDDPLLVGARWWQESMALVDPIARRKALLGIAAVLATATLMGTCAVTVKSCGSPDVDVTSRESLAAQKEHGWSFGSETDTLTFEGATEGAIDPATLDRLSMDLMPKTPEYLPYYVPTLFQATSAPPPTAAPATAVPSLRSVLKPIYTNAMEVAFQRGQALATLFEGAPPGKAVVVDLPGPEAVAFAAGLSSRFDPVFLFDNWPHPKGVVPSHLTLAAAVHYAPLLARAGAVREGKAPPAFILDENRLLPYTDESDRFDNRYTAKLPPAAKLRELGVNEVLYVRGTEGQTELDDLNTDFVDYGKENVPVRYVAAASFQPGPADGTADDWSDGPDGGKTGAPSTRPAHGRNETRYYYGAPHTHWFFWPHYGWGAPPRPAVAPPFASPSYRPAPRPTIFSGSGFSRTRPSNFGSVGVVKSRSTGEVVGSSSTTGRGGSWGRSSTFSGG